MRCPLDPHDCPVCSSYTGAPRGPGDEVLNTWANTEDSQQWLEDHADAGIQLEWAEP